MNILFRADANGSIGQGHVMRTLSLADAFTQNGHKCTYVCAKDSYIDTIIKRGYEVISLKTLYNEMDNELEEISSIISGGNYDAVIVDSYYTSFMYLSSLKNFTTTVYMDDVYEYDYPVDILVNYNIYANENKYKEVYKENVVKTTFVLGPKYAPLRKEFSNIPERKPNKEVERIAVSFGGADPMHMAKGFLDEVLKDKTSISKKEIHLILGAMEPDMDEIVLKANDKGNIKIHVNVPDMKSIFLNSDMAVSAAGSTQYEICACQVPCVNFSMADNQVPGGEEFSKQGIFHYVGDVRYVPNFYEALVEAMDELASNYELRAQMAQKERDLIDGNGALRLAEKIEDIIKNKRL